MGDVVGFLGHNGNGKTTTIKMITELLQPDEIASAFITYLDAEFDRSCIDDPKPVWVLPDDALPVSSLDFYSLGRNSRSTHTRINLGLCQLAKSQIFWTPGNR